MHRKESRKAIHQSFLTGFFGITRRANVAAGSPRARFLEALPPVSAVLGSGAGLASDFCGLALAFFAGLALAFFASLALALP